MLETCQFTPTHGSAHRRPGGYDPQPAGFQSTDTGPTESSSKPLPDRGATRIRFPEFADEPYSAAFGGREFELWQPILALAAWLDELGADELLAVVSGFAEQTIESGREDTIPEADEALLRILAEHVQAGTHTTLRAGNILSAACDADPTTFGPKEKPRWSPKGISVVLGRYRLRTGKRGGKKTYHGVTIPELQGIERAYGFDLGLTSSNVPDVPQCTPTLPPGAVFDTF